MTEAEREAHHHRIHYVELPVTDIQAAKRFYAAAFGWRFQDWGPVYASFEGAGLDGGLRLEPQVAPGGPLVVLYSRELEATRAGVVGAGGRVVRDVFEFPGGRRFHFADPSGNELAAWSDR